MKKPMTPEEFREQAQVIAGRFWKTHLGPMIGKSRGNVGDYARGKREVSQTVRILMVELVRRKSVD